MSRQPGRLNSSLTCDFHPLGAGQVGLVDHDDVGHFQQAGLFPLQFVAGLGLHQQHDDVGQLAHGRVALPGADGFQQDHVEAEFAPAAGSSGRRVRPRPGARWRRPGCG